MATYSIGIGEYKVSLNHQDILQTFALGSCVAVVLLAANARAAGLAHIVLPDSTLSPTLARQQPGRFADTGIACLLKEMETRGCRREKLTAKITGVANILNDNETFKIGKRNIIAVKEWLAKNGIPIAGADIGKSRIRSVMVEVGTGKVTLFSAIKGTWTL
ncbi:MAG: chemotaxis protein CheD [Heliobacteriaceae bacterium]|nr:chemotaxis protein CheD [Heliobacteriaceae bacterium]